MPAKFYVAVKAVVVQNNQALLVLKSDYDPKIWDLPGGRMEQSETLEETLHRELQEETGIQQFTILQPLFSWRWPHLTSDNTPLIMNFFAVQAQVEKITLSHEHSEYAWVTKDSVASLDGLDDCMRRAVLQGLSLS